MKWKCKVNIHSSTPRDSVVKNSMQEMQVSSLDQKDPMQKEMATHSIILAWEIPWTESGGLHTTHRVEKELDMTKQLNNNNNRYITPQINEALARV